MRVAEDLNHALHELFAADQRLHLLGEDIADPYGGAFKVTAGLSDRYPDRVLATPLSEGGIVGVAAGLALAGDPAIVEIMFGDFVALCFDQLVNFAAKSVTMYGRPIAIPLLVRCPVGGGRGYGPTHSQSPQKHFIGVPGLHLFEMSPFHDNRTVLRHQLDLGRPCLYFEDKVLYTRQAHRDGRVDEVFSFDLIGGEPGVARVFIDDPDHFTDVVIATGGTAHRAMAAIRTRFLDEEVGTLLLVPSRLYPMDLDPLLSILAQARRIIIVEESVAGGTWGAELAAAIYPALWGRLREPVRLVHSAASIIPTAAHLEQQVLVGERPILDTLTEAER